jgi:hypothetical protein
MRRFLIWLVVLPVVSLTGFAAAQTTSPGPAIDVEVFNPVDASNLFCAAPGDTLVARLYVRPATGPGTSFSCTLPCGSASGGPANIAAAAVDIGFDGSRLAYFSAANNPDPGFAAVDGLLQTQNLASGRLGWALAGDWTPDGSTGGTLADPCSMLKLDHAGWVASLAFNVMRSGPSALTVRDEPVFPLSFADACGPSNYTSSNGGIDEVVSATVATGSPQCPALDAVIFRNGFETGGTTLWQATP